MSHGDGCLLIPVISDYLFNSFIGRPVRNLQENGISLQSHKVKAWIQTGNIGLTIPGNWSFEIRRISGWNLADFRVKSCGFQVWNPPDFMKSRMWAFAWWSSIGLSFERPISVMNVTDRFFLPWYLITNV